MASEELYSYDEHGNMTSIGVPVVHKPHHLKDVEWDPNDQMQFSVRNGVTTYYVYDHEGQRVRKVSVNNTAGRKTQQRCYLGNFEVFRKYDGSENVSLERETLHVMDDQQRIALVERRTSGSSGEAHLIRYQLSNHLGSSSVELKQDGTIVSYEEYLPFGSTAYQGNSSELNRSRKRYRYTGKERDEETGLYYHGARYYVVWLCIWLSSDPKELIDGVNTYTYCRNSPLNCVDVSGYQSEPIEKIYSRDPNSVVMPGNENSDGLFSFVVDFFTPEIYWSATSDEIDKSEFYRWHKEEKRQLQEEGNWIEEINKNFPCPDSLYFKTELLTDSNRRPVVGIKRPVAPDGWSFSAFEPSEKYHGEGSMYDMRREMPGGKGQQCIYDTEGKLLTDYRAGTPDKHSPSDTKGFLDHWKHDVTPFEMALRLDGNPHQIDPNGKHFNMYLQVRTPSKLNEKQRRIMKSHDRQNDRFYHPKKFELKQLEKVETWMWIFSNPR